MSFMLSMSFIAFEVFCLAISENVNKDIQWSIGAVYRKRTRVLDSMALLSQGVYGSRDQARDVHRWRSVQT